VYNEKRMLGRVAVLVAVLVLGLASFGTGAWGGENCRIFLVFSYHPSLSWHVNAKRGLLDALRDMDCLYKSFYMDTKRHPEELWIGKKAYEALKEVKEWKPAVVVTFDDNATRMVGGGLLGTSTPVVFLGVNAEPERYGFVRGTRKRPGANVTGVLERHYFAQTFKLLKALVPGIEKCAVLSDDSYTSRVALDYCRSLEPSFPVKIVGYYTLRTFQEWQERVLELQSKADCLLFYNALTVRGSRGKMLSNEEVIHWTVKHSRLSDGGVWEAPVKCGLLGGVILTGYYQGYYAGLKVKEILMGKSPGEIPIERPPRGEIAINLARARSLGLKLPMGVLLSARIYGGRQ